MYVHVCVGVCINRSAVIRHKLEPSHFCTVAQSRKSRLNSVIRSSLQLWKDWEMHSQKTSNYLIWGMSLLDHTDNWTESMRLFLLCHSKFTATGQCILLTLSFIYAILKTCNQLRGFKPFQELQIRVFLSPHHIHLIQTKSSYLLLIREGKSHEDHEHTAHLNNDSKIKSQRDLFSLSLRSSSKILILADLFPLIYFFLTAWMIAFKCLVTLKSCTSPGAAKSFGFKSNLFQMRPYES